MTKDSIERRNLAVGLWMPGVTDPLVPLDQRIWAEAELIALADEDPAWAALLWGGTIADLAGTLPGPDPWRACSARVGNLTVGDNPPDSDGAVLSDGRPLGRLDDFAIPGIDMEAFDDARQDLDLAPVAEPLSPSAAALIAFGFGGWRQARSAASELAGKRGGAGLARSALEAFRWAAFRRRAWIRPAPDDFPAYSVMLWLARSLKDSFGDLVEELVITQDIESHMIRPSAVI